MTESWLPSRPRRPRTLSASRVSRFPSTLTFRCLFLILASCGKWVTLSSMPHRHKQKYKIYWRKNLQYLAILLSIWFTVSYGFGILLVEQLDNIRIGGFGLGFWFAQQGSIYVFVILIFVYVWLMNRLDRKYGFDEKEDDR